MTVRIAAALVLSLLATSCGEAAPVTSGSISDDLAFPYCGGELKPGAAAAYFQRLKAALDHGEQPVPLIFYDERISIQSNDRNLIFKRDDFRPGSRHLLSNAEWSEISARGFGDLKDLGWRGCALADGKAGFEADENGELVLSSFDKDRAWVP